jgi:hypothetical protein
LGAAADRCAVGIDRIGHRARSVKGHGWVHANASRLGPKIEDKIRQVVSEGFVVRRKTRSAFIVFAQPDA